jgi:hypothetical protein
MSMPVYGLGSQHAEGATHRPSVAKHPTVGAREDEETARHD